MRHCTRAHARRQAIRWVGRSVHMRIDTCTHAPITTHKYKRTRYMSSQGLAVSENSGDSNCTRPALTQSSIQSLKYRIFSACEAAVEPPILAQTRCDGKSLQKRVKKNITACQVWLLQVSHTSGFLNT